MKHHDVARKLRHEVMVKAVEVARQEGFTIKAVESKLGHVRS